MEEQLVGRKEMFDVNIRLNSPIEIGKRKYDINETVLSFDKAEIGQLQQQKSVKTARGGYGNRALVDWETDKECTFAITHGLLSLTSWAILSNSKISDRKTKSISYKETLDVIEDDDFWFVDLKYMPNHVDGEFGLQYNPENEPMPMGRKPWLPLKPLPPQRDRFIFCYDGQTGGRIMNFDVCGNRIIFHGDHRKVVVDYTFDYDDGFRELNVGNRLFNGYLNLTAKMSVKGFNDGEVTTAILEIPKIKLNSNLSMRLGSNVENPVISDFYFTGYPGEGRMESDQTVCKLTFLDRELTGDYL